MRKSYSKLAGIAGLIVLTPIFVSALTTQELTIQIQALLTQIAALQQHTGALPSVQTNTYTTPNYCPNLSRTLFRGMSGADVRSLQGYLAWQEYMSEDSVTGFFGAITEEAVQRWQAAHGVVSSGSPESTGWGVVGARTRQAIMAQCANASGPIAYTPVVQPTTPSCPVAPPPSSICSTGWQANTDANGCTVSYKCAIPLQGFTLGGGTSVPGTGVFSASPTSGPPPLAVTFYTNIQSPTSYEGGVYQIDYGDNRTDGIAGCSLASVCSIDSGSRTHVYTAGTYTARLIFINRASCSNSSVACTSGQQTIASVTVVVGGSSSSSFSVSPPVGAVPLTVSAVFPPEWQSLVNTECNSSVARFAGRTFSVDWGDGTYPQQNGRNAPCGVHTYTTAGTYTVRAKVYDFSDVNEFNGNFTRDVWTGTASVTAGGSTSSSGSLTIIPGSDALTVAARFFSGRACAEAWQLSWGDGTTLVTQTYTPPSGGTGCAMDLRSNDYSHTYASAGTYIVVLRQGINLERTYSATVAVTNSTSSRPAISVSQSPSSVAKGQNVAISWSSQNAPTASVVLLRLVDAQTGAGEGIIARALNTSGNYTWTVPTASGVQCPDCGGIQTVKTGSYKISAEIYTPSNAYLGDTFPPQNPTLPTFFATTTSGTFSITQ